MFDTPIIANIVGGGQGGSADTTPDGKQFFLAIGDSISRGSALDGLGAAPTANTVFGVKYSDLSLNSITTHDFGDYFITPTAPDVVGSQWPKFGADYYAATGRKPCILATGVPSSTFANPAAPGGSWNNAGALYAAVKAKAIALLAANGVTRLKGIIVTLGINDASGAQSLPTIQAAITEVFTNLLTDFPNTPILINQIGTSGATVIVSRTSSVRAMLKQVCIDNSLCHMVGSIAALRANSLLYDSVHPSISGCNELGSMCARWFSNTSYSKWANSIISSQFDSLTLTRKALLDTFVTTIGASAFTDIDCWYQFKTSNAKNVFQDNAFLMCPTQVGSVFTVNDSVAFNGGAQYIRSGCAPSLTNNKSTQTDAFFIAKIKTNSIAAGSAAYLFGGNNAVIFMQMLQTIASSLSVAANSGTSTTDATETKMQNDSCYGLSINGTTVSLLKNGVVVKSATVSTTGVEPLDIYIGGSNDNGTFSAAAKLTGSLEYFVAGKVSTVNQATLYAALEALNDAW